MLLAPLRRDRFVTGPGPDRGGSTSGQVRWAQMPEKSGMDADAWGPAGRAAGAASCPKAGTTTDATSIANKRQFRCTFMPTSRPGPLSLSRERRRHTDKSRAEERWRVRQCPLAAAVTRQGRGTRNLPDVPGLL